MGGHVPDHLHLDLALGEVPAGRNVGVAAESIEVAADHDRLQRHRLGVLHDAEGGPGGGRSLCADLDDGVQHEMTAAWRVAVVGVSAGGHREQLGDVLGARHPLRARTAEPRAGEQRADPVEIALVDQLRVAVQQLGDRQLVLDDATHYATCPFTTGRPGSLAASNRDGDAPAAIRCAANEAIIAPLSVQSPGRGIRSASPPVAQRSSASTRSRELAATPPAINNVDTPSSFAARTALRVSTSATAS